MCMSGISVEGDVLDSSRKWDKSLGHARVIHTRSVHGLSQKEEPRFYMHGYNPQRLLLQVITGGTLGGFPVR